MAITVNTDFKRASPRLISEFRRLLKQYHSITPGVSDVMNRLNAMSSDIKPLWEGIRIVGSALTVKTIAADLAPVIRVLDYVKKDDLIVIDTGSSKDSAFWGEMVAYEAQLKGAVGSITDAACRDVLELKKMSYPTLSAGIAARAAALIGFGYINVPIQCGGIVVNPGDIVIVDDNGVVCVPQDEAEEVLKKTEAFLAQEMKIVKRLEAGESLGKIVNLDAIERALTDPAAVYDKKRHHKK